MQPTEGMNVSRRALDVEDYIDIMRRHKGWVFGPFLFTLVASVVGVYLWPDSYVSQAVVKIVPQQVPETMVQSAVNQQMADRINSMAQTILSRTVLTTIINTFGLYPRERSREPIEDVIEDMKKKITIQAIGPATGGSERTVPAFAVQFSYENRYLAQRVVQDLVSRFIDENIRNRSNATFQTTQFMKDEMEQSKKQLDSIEDQLTRFRVANNGRLPDQLEANIGQMNALQTQVTYLDSQISRANQERLEVEANIRIYKDQMAALTKEPPESAAAMQEKNEKLAEVDREIDGLDRELNLLKQHYKDTYPDVQTVATRLAAAKKRREDIVKEESTRKPGPAAPRPVNPQVVREARDLDGVVRRLETAVEAKNLEIQEYNKQMRRASEAMKAYQGRIENVPLGEKEYGDLLRDRDMAKQKYIEIEAKLERAQIAQEMEGRKQGETLELLDPASLPQNPAEPKRPLVISIGAGLGLLLGIVIAGAREMKDTSLKNLKDVRAYTQMAILGSVPLLENDFVVRRRRRLSWLGWTTACLAAVVVIAGSIVYYYVSKV